MNKETNKNFIGESVKSDYESLNGLERLNNSSYKKEVANKLRNELESVKGGDDIEKLRVFKKFLLPSSMYAFRLDRFELDQEVAADKNMMSSSKMVKELEGQLEKYLDSNKLEANDNFVLVMPEDSSSFENAVEKQSLDEIVIQNKDAVLKNITELSKKNKKNILNYSITDVKGMTDKEKVNFLDCFKNQSEERDLGILVEYYKNRIEEGSVVKEQVDSFVYALIIKMHNYENVTDSLQSVMHGSLGSMAGPRSTIDAKKNLDLELGDISAKNKEMWEGSKEFIKENMERFKDAPAGVKALMLFAVGSVGAFGYYVLNARTEDGKEPLLTKGLKYSLFAIAGYAGFNLLSDMNEKEAPKDYEKLNKVVRENDYAEFFTGREATEQEEKYAGTFIESLYEPRFNNLEFAEVMNKHTSGASDSAEWLRFVNGKNLDAVSLHGAMGLIKNRYNPENGLAYKDKSIPEEVKEDMRAVWEIAMVERDGSSEYSYEDVVLHLLAIDPKFTFRNERYKGNMREEVAEYTERQNKIQQLERAGFLDPVTEAALDSYTNEELDSFLKSIPFMGETTEYVKKFVAGFHERQGELGDIFVNIDEIKSEAGLKEYMEATKDPQFNILKKRLSFMGSALTLEKGQVVEIESRFDKIESPSYLTPEALTEPYESAIAVPGRSRFFYEFKVVDRYGKELNQLSNRIEFRTLNANGDASDPEIIIFPEGVKIEAKQEVELEDYVFYGKDIRFL